MTAHYKAPTRSCPTCEYKTGQTGQPVPQANGSMTCNICNSTWREIDHQNLSSQQNTRIETSSRTADISDIQFVRPRDNFRHVPSASNLRSIGFGASCVLVFGLAFGLLLSDNSIEQVNRHEPALVLDRIKIEKHRNNKNPFWTISARITNQSDHTVAVPPILMKSGSKGSSGYFDRTFRPALQKLAPGTNLVIRTSINKPVGSSPDIKMEFAANSSSSG